MLEIGKVYRDGWNKRVTILGPTKDNPEWVYSLQGNWYEKATGRFVWTNRDGSHVLKEPTNYDVDMSKPPEDFVE